jgi:hypothetical protein
MFEKVLEADPDYLPLYEELAFIHQRVGPSGSARSWTVRAIDNGPLYAAETPEAKREAQQRLYNLRRENLDLTSRLEMNAYTMIRSAAGPLSGVTTGTTGGATPSSSGVEVDFRPLAPVGSHPRIQLFGRAAADVVGGSVADENRDQLSIGIRYQPFPRINLAVSAERAVAGQPLGPWLFRGLYSWDSGFSLQPAVRSWRYAFVLADTAVVPGGRERAAAYLETRHGITLNVRDAWLITPHVVGDFRIADAPAFASATIGYVEAGLGTSFKYLFNEDAYRSHRAAVETIVQFRQRFSDGSLQGLAETRPRSALSSGAAGGWVLMSGVSLR